MKRIPGVLAFLIASLLFAAVAPSARAQFVSFERWQLTHQGGDGTEAFGSAVAIQGARIMVGAPASDAVATDAGEVQWFTAGSPPAYAGSIFGSDIAASDGFGASLALDGDRLVVAAPNHAPAGARCGAVYVFAWDGAAWVQEAKLWPSDGAAGDSFGSALALSGDTLVVGAWLHDAPANPDEGAAYVFVRSGGTWAFQQQLGTSDHAPLEEFGIQVAVDGDRIAVATVYGTIGYPGGTGSVFVFLRSGGGWVPDGRLVPPGFAGPNGTFGRGLAIQGDVLAIGQPYAYTPDNGIGMVYVHRSIAGTWTYEAGLYSPWTYVPSQLVGEGLALVGDRIVAGATWLAPYGFASGGVFVYRRNGATWAGASAEQILFPSSGATAAFVGRVLASDSERVVVGRTGAAGAQPIVWVFDHHAMIGTELCFGDGSGTACPCGNATPAEGRMGCAVESFPHGATLRLSGSASISADDLMASVFGTGGQGQMLVLAAGTTSIAGGAGVPFGDGLRCIGGAVQRLGQHTTSPAYGTVVYGPGIRGFVPWSAGATHYFQGHFRLASGPCGSGFNLTNAVALTFTP